jgi:Family of unknown function (DUF6524)
MFGPINFLLRWVFTLFLVFSTYNPSGRSFFHWANSGQAPATTVAVAAIMILAAYVFLIRATWRSVKPLGALLIAVFLTLFNLMLVDLGLVPVANRDVIVAMVLASLSTLLAVGVSFSAIRARLSGQVDSDDVGR